ncbi:hypothetical protein [Lacibacter sp.]|uniref:hypothetical protein n=1 Tax=Lacibacter sp. TaxID=1915409 RepID=UPI002B4B8A22|nr:hypothetical protein [Lacibacter sp.]HLP37079.1 hypothetical protein [Lacibacter sp.]
MILELHYIESLHQPVAAAFLRGNDVKQWMLEIGRWNVPVSELDCYILPQSIHVTDVGGLFVVFKNPALCKKLDLLEPYYCIDQYVFIPANTRLYPEIRNEELRSVLLWELQVFHPTIGLTGFEKKDKVNLADLFSYEQNLQTDWSFAHPGIPDRILFNQILVEQMTPEEIIDAIKESIQPKPLEEIPLKKGEQPSAFEKFLDKIKLILFTGIFSVVEVVVKIIPESSSSNNYEGEGILQKLQSWLHRNMDELQKKRDREINRLLNMFEENTDEALQYAIPLNSPYLNRGSQSVSDRLTRNPLKFNLGKLGGGDVVDGWNLGDRYYDLRTKYMSAAQKQIEQRDFKKAAYIYAHLMGDYSSAANVLEQGNLYREAAALYKDHLKNTSAAASCLERGGLYTEAIELYKELQQDEKAADLFMKINQPSNAEQYYEKAIISKLKNSDYLDASRVMYEKMDQPERAKIILLDGWNNTNQYEPCLKKFFDIVHVTEAKRTEEIVGLIYTKELPRYKRPGLLNVLEYVNKKHADEAVKEKVQNIAYKIIHDEAEEGNVQLLHSLKRFVPGDLLIGADASRYITNNKKQTFQEDHSKLLHLDQSIKWLKAISHRNQFLAIGSKNGHLQMARGNWYGNLEYYSWSQPVKNHTRFTFIHSPYQTNKVYLHSSEGLVVNKKDLPKNKYFTETVHISCPSWLQNNKALALIGEDGYSYLLSEINSELTLQQYSNEGLLKKSTSIRFKTKNFRVSFNSENANLIYKDGHYYTFSDKHIISFSEFGNGYAHDLETGVRLLAAPDPIHEFYLVISTNKGCYVTKPDREELNLHGEVFAQDFIPNQIVFISATRFVLAEKRRAILFEIDSDYEPVLLQQFETHASIVGVLQGNNRNQLALIEETGRITICDIV